MEDVFSVAYQQTEDEKDLEYAFFGIFDGHGGREAAIFAKVINLRSAGLSSLIQSYRWATYFIRKHLYWKILYFSQRILTPNFIANFTLAGLALI